MKLTSSALFFLIAFNGLGGLATHAWGQALPGQGALPPLMAEALARHPQVRMQQALASAAGIDVDSARWQYFPTPSVSMERANSTNDPALVNRDDPVTTVRLSQPIWTGGKLGANVTRATELKQSKEAAVQEARQQLSLRVLQAYTDWHLAHLRGKAFEDSLQAQRNCWGRWSVAWARAPPPKLMCCCPRAGSSPPKLTCLASSRKKPQPWRA